jgi:hypothetical protein
MIGARARAGRYGAGDHRGGAGAGVAPVCIGVVAGPLRAELTRSYLEQAGISVYAGAAVAGAYGLSAGLGEVRSCGAAVKPHRISLSWIPGGVYNGDTRFLQFQSSQFP